MMSADAYSLPAPWQASHCMPSSMWKPSVFSQSSLPKLLAFSQSSVSEAVAWQPRHILDLDGSSVMPLNRAISLDSGRAREA